MDGILVLSKGESVLDLTDIEQISGSMVLSEHYSGPLLLLQCI